MDFKLIGCILLIVGTSIGAGMLALPIATAELGFVGSLILLFVCWFVMTVGAFLILETNLWMPLNSNLNTMAKSTLGPLGQIICWISVLLLLYSLLCAYIGGGSDLFHNLLFLSGFHIPRWQASIIFVLIFGFVVYRGIKSIDYVNRGLMLIKFSAYFLLIFSMASLISPVKLSQGDIYKITTSTPLMVTITAFGYALIVPSLRIYFEGDIAKLKKAIIFGSLIPLVCYIAWDAVIMGVIPREGSHGLIAILQSENSTSGLVNSLTTIAANPSITLFTQVFTSVCVLTSFLGVSLILTDFWIDALQIEKKLRLNNLLVCFLTLLPPLIIVLFFPGVFVKALEYAGIDCVILLVLLPACMVWVGRYKRHFTNHFTVPGGRLLLVALSFFSVIMLMRL